MASARLQVEQSLCMHMNDPGTLCQCCSAPASMFFTVLEVATKKEKDENLCKNCYYVLTETIEYLTKDLDDKVLIRHTEPSGDKKWN